MEPIAPRRCPRVAPPSISGIAVDGIYDWLDDTFGQA